MTRPSLKNLLKQGKHPIDRSKDYDAVLEDLQLKMLRIQRGIWHAKKRALVIFEGFDAAGKGGAIRRLTGHLDPRGVRVHAFGPPDPREQGRHYLYRFWKALPPPGELAIFDRSWYGRVLVERVKGLAPERRLRQAYEEIARTERMLLDDGVDLVKIFLAISPREQLKRFEARIRDPYKQWKITSEDIEARAQWDDYVKATEEMLRRTHTKGAPWTLVAGDHKHYARRKVLETVVKALGHHALWMEKKARKRRVREIREALEEVEKQRKKR